MAEYRVTGVLNPDATGVYVEAGTYLGFPAYRREDTNYWIWSPGGDIWTLSTEPGELDPGYWAGSIPGIAQVYDPVDDYTGDATVALIDPEPGPGGYPCCCEGLPCLCGEVIPDQLKVTIAGVVNHEPAECEDCDDLNGEYILDTGYREDPEGLCWWIYNFDPAVCTALCLSIRNGEEDDGGKWRGGLSHSECEAGQGGFGGYFPIYGLTLTGDDITCMLDHDFPEILPPFFSPEPCDFSSATFHVEAL